MEVVLSWVGGALAALFVTAVFIAWWEHMVRSLRRPVRREAPAPRAVTVDVPLDTLDWHARPAIEQSPLAATAAAPRTDIGRESRAMLDEALNRSAHTAHDGSGWDATGPMDLQALEVTHEGPRRAVSGPSSSASPAPIPAPETAQTAAVPRA